MSKSKYYERCIESDLLRLFIRCTNKLKAKLNKILKYIGLSLHSRMADIGQRKDALEFLGFQIHRSTFHRAQQIGPNSHTN